MDYCWQGPFVITTIQGKGLYSLTERDGNQVVKRVNGFHFIQIGRKMQECGFQS